MIRMAALRGRLDSPGPKIMSFLSLQSLTKHFDSVKAVSEFSLNVEQGEFVSLLGPSGCGKTTALHMIAGFVEPSQGRITLDGTDVTAIKANRRGIGIMFQSYALFPHMTVAQNVRFGLEMRRVSRPEQRRRVSEALELVRLNGLDERYPRELSGGQCQRVALARALVIKPPLLLLDEPLSNLDAKLREDMQLELRNIQQQLGTTTVMVTHDQAEALSLSDRVVVMNQGEIVQVDEPFRAYEQPHNAFVSAFVGKTNLLQGQVIEECVDTMRVRMGNSELELPSAGAPAGEEVQLSIRPEKLELTDCASGYFSATVRTRHFLGNHWLYQLDSSAGDLLVTQPNNGSVGFAVDEEVGVRWTRDAVCVVGGIQNA